MTAINPMYIHSSSVPNTNARGVSATTRAEFDAVEDGFEVAQNSYTDTGTASAIVIAPVAQITSLTDGLRFWTKTAAACTGATTVNLGTTLGTKALRLPGGSALTGTEYTAGQWIGYAWNSAAGYLELFSAGLPVAANGLPITGGTMTGAINEAKGANIASAATINLNTATGNFVHVTGTTTITAITLNAGAERTVIFDGVLTLTHNASSLILPSAANITTAANDRMIVRGDTGGVIVVSYTKADGMAIIENAATVDTSVASATLVNTSKYIQVITPTGTGQYFQLPDATTISIKRANYLLVNNGDYDVGVRDGSGVLKYNLQARSSVPATCRDISATAGVWAFGRPSLPAINTVAYRVDGYSESGNAWHKSSAILSSSLAVYGVVNPSGHLYVIAVNPLTGATGLTPTLIEATASIGTNYCVYPVTATTAVFFYKSGTNLKGVVVSFSGVTPTVNSIATLAWSALNIGSGFSRVTQQLSATSYFIAAPNGTTDIQGAASTITGGTTVNFGALTTVVATFGGGAVGQVRTALVDSTHVAVWGADATGTNVRFAVSSISGTTPTPGASVSLASTVAAMSAEVVICSATEFACLVRNDATTYNLYAASLSGVTTTLSAARTVTVTATADFANADIKRGYALSATEALFYVTNASSDIEAFVATVSGSSQPAAVTLSGFITTSATSTDPTTEPATDVWPAMSFPANTYPNVTTFNSVTRSGSASSVLGKTIVTSSYVRELWYSVKLSGASTWLFVSSPASSVSANPKAFVCKKVGDVIVNMGEIPMLHDTFSGGFTQSGQLIAFKGKAGNSAPIIYAMELVS